MRPSWLTLPLNEWRRRPARSTVTLIGVALAVAAFVSLVAFERGYRRGLQNELDRIGAHILIVPKGCPYDAASLALHGANWPCYLKTNYLAEVRAVPGVKAAVPALMHALRDQTGGLVVYLGADSALLSLRPHWRIRGRFPERAGEFLAGGDLSRRYGWGLGQSVALPGFTNRAGTVCGILEPTGGADDYFVHLLLAEAQRLFLHPQELTHVLVRLDDPTQMEEVVQRLRGCEAGMNLNVVPLTHLFRTIQGLVSSTRSLLACVVAVAALLAGAGVTNALLMAVSERTRELGVFRVLGASRVQVFRIVLTESLALSAAGGALGIAGALAGSHGLEAWLRARLPFVPLDSLVAWDPAALLAGLAAAILLGSLAACLPAWRACNVVPKTAMCELAGGV